VYIDRYITSSTSPAMPHAGRASSVQARQQCPPTKVGAGVHVAGALGVRQLEQLRRVNKVCRACKMPQPALRPPGGERWRTALRPRMLATAESVRHRLGPGVSGHKPRSRTITDLNRFKPRTLRLASVRRICLGVNLGAVSSTPGPRISTRIGPG